MQVSTGDMSVANDSWSKTLRARSHYSCPCGLVFGVDVYHAIDVSGDPALGRSVLEGRLNLVKCPTCRAEGRADLPLTYHDANRLLFLLVLPPAFRYRELEERAALLLRMAQDQADIPPYARRFDVVYGTPGLVKELERRAQVEVEETARGFSESQLEQRESELAQREEELLMRQAEFDRLAQQPQRAPSVVETLDDSDLEPVLDSDLEPVLDSDLEPVLDSDLEPVLDDRDNTKVQQPVQFDGLDAAKERWLLSRENALCLLDDDRVRLFFRLTPTQLEALLSIEPQIRIQLHRMPSYSLVVLSVGAPGDEPAAALIDPAVPDGSRVLEKLGEHFSVSVEMYDHDYLLVAQKQMDAPLAENATLVVEHAHEHLATLPEVVRSFSAASDLWHSNAFDRWGKRAQSFDSETFLLLPTPGATLLAVEEVAHWCRSENENQLLLVLSFPASRWKRIRSRVVARAVDCGLALTPELTGLALDDHLAQTQTELLTRLLHTFAGVARGIRTNDLRPEQIEENWGTLFAQCHAQRITIDESIRELAATAVTPPTRTHKKAVTPRNRTSDTADLVAGEIGGDEPVDEDLCDLADEELIERLSSKERRQAAAIELCRRGVPSAVGPVFGVLRRMLRGDAALLLPHTVGFGERATPHLLDGLRSKKAFLRHGCALAIGVLKIEDGIEPLCDLLLAEPTDVWREIARAIGEVGPNAVMSLVSRLKGNPTGHTASGKVIDKAERVSWALAHVLAHGGRRHVEALSKGRDRRAAEVATHALSISEDVQTGDAEVRGTAPMREHTVNRSFSRKFFRALARRDGPATEDVLALDESEIAFEDEDILDDDDIMPS